MSETTVLYPEEHYSAFYKAQLRLFIQDDYEAFEGGVHKYTDHIHRRLGVANHRNRLGEFHEHWFYRDDETQPPFRGANLRTFFTKNSDPDLVIWKVFDLYAKYTNPLLAHGFNIEGYLERLGLTLSEYIHPVQSVKPPAIKHSGLFSCNDNPLLRLYLDIQRLADRRYAIAHMVHENLEEPNKPVSIDGFQDNRTRIDKGVCVPQTQNDLLIIRDIESADVSFAFVTANGDNIRCHRIHLDGSVQILIFEPDDNTQIRQMIKAASFKEED